MTVRKESPAGNEEGRCRVGGPLEAAWGLGEERPRFPALGK